MRQMLNGKRNKFYLSSVHRENGVFQYINKFALVSRDTYNYLDIFLIGIYREKTCNQKSKTEADY